MMQALTAASLLLILIDAPFSSRLSRYTFRESTGNEINAGTGNSFEPRAAGSDPVVVPLVAAATVIVWNLGERSIPCSGD